MHSGDNAVSDLGQDLSGTLQGAGGVGGLLTCHSVSTNTSISYTVAYDGNGNVLALVDLATGAIRADYEYSPFGETIRSTGPLAEENAFRFSTKYTDDETGLVYYGLRYYSPALGRWLNRDPIGENFVSGEIDLYNFLINDGLNRVDYLGLRDVISRGQWAKDWIKRNPNMAAGLTLAQKKSFRDRLRRTRDRGCIGLTCIELGDLGHPDLLDCFETKQQAQTRQQQMKRNRECCTFQNLNNEISEPRLFSVHLWNDKGKDGVSPDVEIDAPTGSADLSNWDKVPQPGGSWVNFDFGYLAEDGKIVHANHLHDPSGMGVMEVYRSTVAEWQRSYRDFNTEVWCVACEKEQIKP